MANPGWQQQGYDARAEGEERGGEKTQSKRSGGGVCDLYSTCRSSSGISKSGWRGDFSGDTCDVLDDADDNADGGGGGAVVVSVVGATLALW